MKKSSIILLVGLALLLSLGANGYQYYKKNQADKSTMSRVSIRNFKDSVNKVIEDLELSLEHMALLQQDNRSMAEAVAKLEARGPKTIIRTNTVDPNEETAALLDQIRTLQRQLKEAAKPVNEIMASTSNEPLSSSDKAAIDKYKNQVESKQKEIINLTSKVEKLEASREKYAQERSASIQGQYDDLKVENDDLKNRFAKGAIPQLGNLVIKGGTMEEGVFKSSTKAKKIDRLRISFAILENPLIIEPLKEEVVIRVINSSGAVLSTKELNGSMMNSSDVYTIKDEIQVDANMQGSAPQVLWFPADGNLQDKLKKGTYSVELISRDKIRQVSEFIVN